MDMGIRMNTTMRMMMTALACLGLAACASGASKPTPTLAGVKALQEQAERDAAAGRSEQALVAYQQLANQLPTNADAWFRLGNAYVRMGQPDQAVAAYEQVLKIEPKHAKAWHNLGVLRLRQAAAAFSESAVDANGSDPSLQQQSTQLVDGIARLTSPQGDSRPPAQPAADAEHGP
jgi:Flp pilus assembly protein TadD